MACIIVIFSFPSPLLYRSLEKRALQLQTPEKPPRNQWSGRIGLEPSKSPIFWWLSLLTCLKAFLKAHRSDQILSSLGAKCPTSRTSLKTIRSNCFTIVNYLRWLYQLGLTGGWKGKTGERDVYSVFEKLQHIPSNLEGQLYVQGHVHTQKRPGKAPISHLKLTLRFCTNRNEG